VSPDCNLNAIGLCYEHIVEIALAVTRLVEVKRSSDTTVSTVTAEK